MNITRRTALTGGIAAVGAVGLTACTDSSGLSNALGFLTGRSGGRPAVSGIQPKVIESANGKLAVTLIAKPTTLNIGGVSVKANGYNGSLPGPTLRVKPGDLLTVDFKNQLGEATNLHTHGFHVSPQANSDNIFVEVADGASLTYQYHIPANHAAGLFWYHPHHHGMAAEQVFSGLYGAIIVEDQTPLKVDFERVLVLSDISFDGSGNILGPSMMGKMMGREGSQLMVNGQAQPNFATKKNAVERWRIVNAATSRYFKLHWSGASVQLLAMDSGRLDAPESVDSVTLAPGNRTDLLVTVTNGKAQLLYDTVVHADAGMMGGKTYQDYPLATFTAGTQAGLGVATGPAKIKNRSLRNSAVDAKRTFTLAMPAMSGMMGGGGRFTINGQSFDHNTVNTTVTFGAVEEWTIKNTSTMNHPFHLHVWPMQLLSVDGVATTETRWQDVVNVPAKGEAVVRIAFEDFKGMAVYHCHILDHEDQGMMGIIQVV